MKIFGPNVYGVGGSGGDTIIYNPAEENQLYFETRVSGAQAQSLPANIIVLSIVAYAPEAKAAVSVSVIGGENGLFISEIDFNAGDKKSFMPGCYLENISEIVTANTTVIDPDPNKKFKFLITFKKQTGF